MPRFTCPLCGAMFMDRDASAAGPLNSCEECGHTFEDQAEEPLPRPRKKRNKKRGRLLLLLLVLGSGLAWIAGGIVLVIVLLRGGGNNLLGVNTGVNPKVTEANLQKLWAGMSLEETQAILGGGKECDAEEITKTCKDSFGADYELIGWTVGMSGKLCGVETWHRWQNGGLHVFAGFRKSTSGVPRLALLRWYCQSPIGAFASMEAITLRDGLGLQGKGVMPHRDWLDHLAAKHDKEVKLLDDPKWKRGAAIRQALIGKWRLPGGAPGFPSVEGHDFNAEGSCVRIDGPGGLHVGHYHFLNDTHIEMTTADEVMLIGGGKGPMTHRYRVLVDDKELILVDEVPAGPILVWTLERQK